MKIKSFQAKGVFGYLNLNVNFDTNPVIFIGPNGSGKTTALRLIQALITPSLLDLLNTDFQEVTLRLDEQGSVEKVISARKTKDALFLSTSTESGQLMIPLGMFDAIESAVSPNKRSSEINRALRLKYADDPVYRSINQLSLPVFLGLDRRSVDQGADGVIDVAAEDILLSSGAMRGARRTLRGSLSEGLVETLGLVQRAYRRIRQVRDQHAERLRKKLLLTGFEYVDFEDNGSSFLFNDGTFTKDVLLQQRDDLLHALVSVGIDESDAKKELIPFFERVVGLANRLSEDRIKSKEVEGNDVLEAMLNRASVGRLKQQVGAVREFNQRSASLMSKFDSFLRCINYFFSDSRKEVEIDSVGLLKIVRPDGVGIPVDALSSGERQLLIMFAHLFFNSFADKSNVFIIDEPELSLHLRWQESLLEKMVESSPRAQIIIATHSPEIVGEMTDHCKGF